MPLWPRWPPHSQVRRYPGWQEWDATAFTIDSGAQVAVGVDGEALSLDPPLEFAILPGALRVRLPQGAAGVSPAALAVAPLREAPGLVRTALGLGTKRVAVGVPLLLSPR
jgi:hypothetical protein